jgi:serine/threonine protein phosphatase PrpC
VIVVPGNAQIIGKRKSQQDAFAFSDLNDTDHSQKVGVLAVLADGMGGLEFGFEASQTAVKTIGDVYLSEVFERSIDEALDEALQKADDMVCRLATDRDQSGNVGTTVVLAVIHDEFLYWRSVGDSRLYLFRGYGLYPVTRDHDYGEILDDQADDGVISSERAALDPERRALTSFIGQGSFQEVDKSYQPLRLREGDRILLCSDGVYNTLSLQEILGILRQIENPHEACEAMVDLIERKDQPHQDNATVMILDAVSSQGQVTVKKRRSKSKIGRFLRRIMRIS